ncbi:RHS repeat-associated core domain-containing protein [Pseudomarimonas arenosa]|uniref:RHS repeat-associated core domain-containing protein n=1 Tax=Pseudomarimonas arenosa TaxID=2774145 RepID=A0AAW3ZVX9_9GAMM|nr:RHS repeat-associated core domain-containing protein [Pseudomarimonas arenosa]MBD8528186.1 RHS repeat-associated core domain-containing protein [Pseudomarimonas arenosa]
MLGRLLALVTVLMLACGSASAYAPGRSIASPELAVAGPKTASRDFAAQAKPAAKEKSALTHCRVGRFWHPPLKCTSSVGYTGYYHDSESGLNYAKARYQLPGVGRFLQVDPAVGDFNRPITLNKYLYANSNPLIYIDPDGRTAELNAVVTMLGVERQDSVDAFVAARNAGRAAPWYDVRAKAASGAGMLLHGGSTVVLGLGEFAVGGGNAIANLGLTGAHKIGVPGTEHGAKLAEAELDEAFGLVSQGIDTFSDRPWQTLGIAVAAPVITAKQAIVDDNPEAQISLAQDATSLPRLLKRVFTGMAQARPNGAPVTVTIGESPNGSGALGQLEQDASAIRPAIRENEIATFEDFRSRSIIGDRLEGHEVLQHALLKREGLVAARHSTDASKQNPVIALDKDVHKKVNKAQRALDLQSQTAIENIGSNARILRDVGIARKKVQKLANKAVEHARRMGLLDSED